MDVEKKYDGCELMPALHRVSILFISEWHLAGSLKEYSL
jgi:hypothetical protein